jgi:hypothetical protein
LDSLSPDTTKPAPPRKRFHLTGPSVALAPEAFAVRRDLAEIAVADRVFAQHYAEPMAIVALEQAVIYAQPRLDSAEVGHLAVGDRFDILDIGKDWAWGRTVAPGGIGYVAVSALDLAP